MAHWMSVNPMTDEDPYNTGGLPKCECGADAIDDCSDYCADCGYDIVEPGRELCAECFSVEHGPSNDNGFDPECWGGYSFNIQALEDTQC